MMICPLCGTWYQGIRRPGDRCDDLSLLSTAAMCDPAERGCVGRVMPQEDYDLIDHQAVVRQLATRRDLHYQPLLRRTPP